MQSSNEPEAGHARRCEVAGVREHSVLLDPGSGRARFVLPRPLVPDCVEVGDRVRVSTRHVPGGASPEEDTGVGEIFAEAREALEGLNSGWKRPGLPRDARAASA